LQFLQNMGITDLITFLLLGIGLSLDSFAVSVSCGLIKQEMQFKQAVGIAFSLALFQGGFPVVGWFIGSSLSHVINSVDHWIAFALLTFVGIKMMAEGIKSDSLLCKFNPFKLSVILGLSVATSIDALVVGLSFGFIETQIWFPVIIIAGVTFIASMLGMLFGINIPAKRSHQFLIPGGIILIFIGIKILVEHLWF
jgi:manganese efflux pump family protein